MIQVNDAVAVFPKEGYIAARLDEDGLRKIQSVPGLQVYNNVVMLPWCDDACRVLANLGVDVTLAAPFMSSKKLLVEGKYKPMTHQLITAAFVTLNPRCYVLNDPRTGKTGSLILAMDYLQREAIVTGGFLIVTTMTTIRSVWAKSILDTLPNALVSIVHGKDRNAALAAPAEFYVTNYDSVRLSQPMFMQAIQDGRIGGIVIDELTHMSNPSSQRSKAMYNLTVRSGVPYVVGLTGSPAEKVDAVFGMCKVINPSRLPVSSMTAWMGLTTYQYGPEAWMRTPTAAAQDHIFNAMQPAMRFRKEHILDLPPVTTQDRICDLSSEQRTVYKTLLQDAVAMLKSGEAITAANGGVLAQKLMQVAQGFCYAEDGKIVELEHKERTQTILDIVAETNRKVVIYGVFRYGIDMIAKELQAAGYTVGIIDGKVSEKNRAAILHRFQHEADPKVLVCHPITVGIGVELSAADTMIFAGAPMHGGFVYAQALERLSSAKQTADNINIVRVMSTAEEKRAFAMMDKGRQYGAIVAEMFELIKEGV